jgi:cytoskeletal protein RodZ
MFDQALGNQDFDAAEYSQQLGQSREGDAADLDIGTTLQIINVVQDAAVSRATQSATAAAAATSGAANNTRYENRGGLQPISAPLPTKSDSTTKSSGCVTCGVR